MAEDNTMEWLGKSGTKCQYWVYEIGHSLKAEGGNYIFTKRDSNGVHTPIYVGQTGDLSERFDSHHKADCIRREGATHICTHLTSSENDRVTEESDLIANWSPPCNG